MPFMKQTVCLSCWEISICIILFLTVIRMERSTGAVTVAYEVKDPSLQKSRVLVEWEKEGTGIIMAIDVAIICALMDAK